MALGELRCGMVKSDQEVADVQQRSRQRQPFSGGHTLQRCFKQNSRCARHALQIGVQFGVCGAATRAAGAVAFEAPNLHQQFGHMAGTLTAHNGRQASEFGQGGVVKTPGGCRARRQPRSNRGCQGRC